MANEITREKAIECNKNLRTYMELCDKKTACKFREENYIALDMAIEALEQLGEKPKTGYWIRMSDLPEEEDDRYQCSHCGNVVHYKDKIHLYTFNSWCGRCGSNNR